MDLFEFMNFVCCVNLVTVRGFLLDTSSEMATYAAAAVVNGKPTLEINEVSLDWDEVEDRYIIKNGRYVHLNMPVATAEVCVK